MDRVTQQNAASAEEDAAVAQKLTAQTLAMKEAIAELLNLVHGENQLADGDSLDHRNAAGNGAMQTRALESRVRAGTRVIVHSGS
jgi:hypothetical protein